MTITRLAPSDEGRVIRLFDSDHQRHLHLDWHSLPALLRDPDLHCWAVRQNGEVAALVGATSYLPGLPYPGRDDQPVAWLRLIVSRGHAAASQLDALWENVKSDLRLKDIRHVCLVALDPWIEPLAARWGFAHTNAVISLRRSSRAIPSIIAPGGVSIRDAQAADLDAIIEVDSAAFEPMWQYDTAMLELAQLHAAHFTVIEDRSRILGYQLSTWHIESGHLARLAVHPREQGRGLGGMLTAHMIRFFAGRKTYTITVNTQADNHASQRLYVRYGFQPINYSVPVWTTAL